MDYLQFYKLKEHPFSNVVDNRFYYASPQHSEALKKLKYMIDRRLGLAVVIGDIGTGKTTLARRLLDELNEQRYEATLIVVIHSSVSSEWLLKKLAMQLGVDNVAENKIEVVSQIYHKLEEIYEADKKTAILIDEVQMLRSRELMEEFRGLLNIETPEGKLANFVFFGLPELDNILQMDEPLKQRIAMRIKLKPLTFENTEEYIIHRLRVAGSEKNIFSKDAIGMIYQYSKGIPRLINTLCDNALLGGFLMKKQEIGTEIIETVVIDLGLKKESSASQDS